MLPLLFPLVASVAHATDILLDRFIMIRHRLGHRQFTIVMFLGLYFWSSLSTIFFGGIETEAFTSRYLAELAVVIVIASLYNMLYYQGIEKKQVEEFEPILMLTPLTTIVVAALFFPAERTLVTLGAAIVGALAVAYPYLYRGRGGTSLPASRGRSFDSEGNDVSTPSLSWDIYQWRLVLYVVLTAIEAVLLKDLLSVYQPATLYAVRTGLILVTLFSFYTFVKPIPLVVISRQHIKEVVLLSIAPTIYFIAMLYAFQSLGIVLSTLLFLVYPIFVYLGARLFLKEKLHSRLLLSGTAVMVCVVIAVWMGSP